MTDTNPDLLPIQVLEQPGFLFTDIARLYRVALDRRMQQHGLTRSQSWLISFLCYFDGSTQQQLADRMETGKGGLGKLIDRLEQKGMVRRETDSGDTRSKRVFLSEHMKPLALEMENDIDHLVGKSLVGIPEADQVVLKRWLRQIRSNLLEEIGSSLAPPHRQAATARGKHSGE